MNEKQFKQLAHDLVVNIASTMGTFTTDLEMTDDDLAKTQKLVKKFDEALTEFIDSRKPKFQFGDYYVIELEYVFAIGVITGEKTDGCVTSWYSRNDNLFIEDSTEKYHNMRHATPEEIAEYKAALNFHKHGRKPFEVKEGDLIINVKINNSFLVKDAENWSKRDFTSSDYKLLKTAEELEEWLADEQ